MGEEVVHWYRPRRTMLALNACYDIPEANSDSLCALASVAVGGPSDAHGGFIGAYGVFLHAGSRGRTVVVAASKERARIMAEPVVGCKSSRVPSILYVLFHAPQCPR